LCYKFYTKINMAEGSNVAHCQTDANEIFDVWRFADRFRAEKIVPFVEGLKGMCGFTHRQDSTYAEISSARAVQSSLSCFAQALKVAAAVVKTHTGKTGQTEFFGHVGRYMGDRLDTQTEADVLKTAVARALFHL